MDNQTGGENVEGDYTPAIDTSVVDYNGMGGFGPGWW